MFSRSYLSFSASTLMLMASTALSQAQSVVTIQHQIFPTESVLPVSSGCTTAVIRGLRNGGSVGLGTASTCAGFTFLFWDINGFYNPNQTPAHPYTPPNDSNTIVSAWYRQVDCTSPCPPSTGVTTWAFSLNGREVIPNTTPIKSVAPPNAAAWTGPPSTTVSTTTTSSPVVITALPQIVPFGNFRAWQVTGGEATEGDPILTVAAGGLAYAIALYGIPVPDPCLNDRDELETCVAAHLKCELFKDKLMACATKYGESLP
jgi:hypothetical protein